LEGFLGSLGSQLLVLLVGNHLKMQGSTAQTNITEMIDLLLAGDITIMMGEYHQMHGDGLAIEMHPGIVPTPAGTGMRPLPDMTGTEIGMEPIRSRLLFQA
jgi:hypothetical protein